MHLSGLFLYPVKSLRGFDVDSADVDALGLVGDRRFLVVDADGRFLTQRTLPRMAQIATALTSDALLLRAEGAGEVVVPLRAAGPIRHRAVSVWRSHELVAEDCGPDVTAWLSAFLDTTCHLVRIGDDFRRPVLRKPRPDVVPAVRGAPLIEGRIVTSDLVNFADGYPFLAVGEASLADLNARLAARAEPPVPMDRFRTNLVIADSAPFAEDTWARFRIGGITFRAAGPCGRCIVTTTNQFTGERTGAEPLRTLAAYRRDASDSSSVNFGQNLVHDTKSGALRIGDPVEVL